MKKLIFGALSALAFTAGIAIAGGNHGGGAVAPTATADAYMFNGTAVDGHDGMTYAHQETFGKTVTDTRPAFAMGRSSASGNTGGHVADRNHVFVEGVQEGNVGAGALVKRPRVADAMVDGDALLSAQTQGHYSKNEASLSMKADLGAIAVDTKHGGFADSDAEQTITARTRSVAFDRKLATAKGSVSVNSQVGESSN